ncbi:ABC transporter permease [Nocardioides pocheonensis]|uniref:ABC transporter permease n=1 Tax=Nocardioides pocheonensis TaxID=661485 RepID=A0A3N0GPB2_9ACTN|nr:ABC transporter permease [Nocardioides pocheonensis]RNM14259.1 ABC transporter permease [Nocardioides pocheonensis]
MTATGTFLRAFLRRDRWLVLWFLLGTPTLYWTQAYSVDGIYRSQAEFDRAAAAMGDNAAFVAMAGPARALNTTGGQVAWQASAFGAIVVGLMAMFIVGRHTRSEEETGREELLRSGVVARTAPMTAALLAATVASAVVAAGVTGSLLLYGLPAAGSWVLGVGVLGCGVAFGGVALLAAQVTTTARATYGLTGAVIGVSYGLRAIGDVSGGGLSWLSPIGWYQAMHAYSGERWWPVVLLVVLGALTTAAAYLVFERRDLGAGIWATRVGPDRASPRLLSGLGLAWRMQRSSVFWWSVGMLVGGYAYGAMGDDVTTMMGDSQFSKDIFAAGGGADLLDSFYAVATLMLVLIAAGFTVSSALRPHSEEQAGRVEALLATGLSRARWYAGQALVTVAGSVVVLLAAGLGIGVGYAAVTGDWSAVQRLTGATFSQLAGLLVLGALARLLHAVAPRWAPLAWLGVLYCWVILMFGELLEFPQWVIDVSPFSHLAAVPAVDMRWTPFLTVLALAAAMSTAGLLAFRHRDVH